MYDKEAQLVYSAEMYIWYKNLQYVIVDIYDKNIRTLVSKRGKSTLE